MKLNLGCGKKLLDGWINLDKGDFGQQVVRDVLRGLPFADDTFDEVMCDNVLEHIPPGDDLVFVLSELYRISRPGARVCIIVPHAFSPAAYQDPTHVSYWTPRNALYFNLDLPWPGMYGSTANFTVEKIEVYGEQATELFIRFDLTARPKNGRSLYQPLVFPTASDPVAEFHKLYYNSQVWRKTYYRGIPIAKCPMDLHIYGEIIHEVKPKDIIETGTYFGGSALWLADHSTARVTTIDIDMRNVPELVRKNPMIFMDECSSLNWNTRAFTGDGVIMVILDSDHSKAHVLKELDLYAPLVTVGSYLIVEDTNVNGNPIEPDFGPGPGEAIAEWLPKHPEFEVDRTREKFLLSFNIGGFLRRLR